MFRAFARTRVGRKRLGLKPSVPACRKACSASPRPAADEPVVPIGVPTDEQALNQASQRVEEVGAESEAPGQMRPGLSGGIRRAARTRRTAAGPTAELVAR